MTVNDCRIVGWDQYQNLLKSIHPDIAVCVRGRHAIGKSEGVYQAAAQRRSDLYKDPAFCKRMVATLSDPTEGVIRYKNQWVSEWNYEMGMPVIERRLSQMTEGDMIGLPYKTSIGESDATVFMACDWLIQSCLFPVVLFLDERNRALPGVKQGVFQLTDSKAFYGNKLHKETNIIVAENVGDAYQVEQCDPAEVSRCATVQLEPSDEEWFEYASPLVHEAIIEFLRTNPKFLEYIGTFEPNKKYPDRRSWMKFAVESERLGLLDQDAPDPLLNVLAGAMLGTETGAAFYKHCQDRERNVSANDILSNWDKAKTRLLKDDGKSNERFVEAVGKLGDWLKAGNKLTPKQAGNLANFMFDCPPEPRMASWANLQKDVDNLFMVHPHIEKLMVATATGERIEGVDTQRKAAKVASKTDSESDVKTETEVKVEVDVKGEPSETKPKMTRGRKV